MYNSLLLDFDAIAGLLSGPSHFLDGSHIMAGE